jgi:hypothetical protein
MVFKLMVIIILILFWFSINYLNKLNKLIYIHDQHAGIFVIFIAKNYY